MQTRLLKLIGVAAVSMAVLVFLKPAEVAVADQAPTPSATAPAAAPVLKTPWGEPDLQGIWTDESDTPLQRPAKYANQEFFTEAQRAELDKERAALLGRDRRVERGTELDVAGAYNAVFMLHEAHRHAHVADCGSAQRPDSAADAGGSEDGRRRPGISSRAVAIDRNVQEQVGGL